MKRTSAREGSLAAMRNRSSARKGNGDLFCRIFSGVSAAFLMLAALLFGATAFRALWFNAIRISMHGIVWKLEPFLRNSYVLLPAFILMIGFVFSLMLTVTGKLRWWIGSVCAQGIAIIVYILIPSQMLAVAQYAELRSFFGFNLIPIVSRIHLLPFQLAECLSGVALLGSGIGFLRMRILSQKQSVSRSLSL